MNGTTRSTRWAKARRTAAAALFAAMTLSTGWASGIQHLYGMKFAEYWAVTSMRITALSTPNMFATASYLSGGYINVQVWQNEPGSGKIAALGNGTLYAPYANAASLRIASVGNNRVVTANLNEGTLEVTAWQVESNGYVTMLSDTYPTSQPMNAIALSALDSTRVITLQQTTDLNDTLTVWSINSSGGVIQNQTSYPGTGGATAMAVNVNPYGIVMAASAEAHFNLDAWSVDSSGNFTFLSSLNTTTMSVGSIGMDRMQSDGSFSTALGGTLWSQTTQIMLWNFNAWTGAINQVASTAILPMFQGGIANVQGDAAFSIGTASGKVRLDAWSGVAGGVYRDEASAPAAETGSAFDVATVTPLEVMTAYLDSSNFVHLDIWQWNQ